MFHVMMHRKQKRKQGIHFERIVVKQWLHCFEHATPMKRLALLSEFDPFDSRSPELIDPVDHNTEPLFDMKTM